MSSFEKSVKGATKVKIAAPKSKYIEHILIATHAGEAGIAEVFRALNNRMKDQTWTIVFKSLIVVHLMIREGEQDVTLRYLRKHPRLIAISNYSDVQEQGRNIRRYSMYLAERARSFGDVKMDYVRNGQGRLRKLPIEKGLLREVDCVQLQLRALLQCNFAQADVDNEITLTAYRMLVSDLLAFFHVVNEGVINVLEHYFEMSRVDAEHSLEIYKTFTRQTEDTVEFLQNARRMETATRLQIPNVKHAPISLTKSLEEYLNDPDFETNRRQYLAQQEAKRNGGKAATGEVFQPKPSLNASEAVKSLSVQQSNPHPPIEVKQERDLIDFFASIENEQTSMFGTPNQAVSNQNFQYSAQTMYGQQQQQQQPQQQQQSNFIQPQPVVTASIPNTTGTGYPPQMSTLGQQIHQNFTQQPAPLSNSFTGAGFGGYTTVQGFPQPSTPLVYSQSPNLNNFQQNTIHEQPQQSMASLVPNQTGTNPFRQSMMPTGSGTNPPPINSMPKNTNPFARSNIAESVSPSPAFGTPPSGITGTTASNLSQTSLPMLQTTQPPQSLTPTPTSTNPFARTAAQQPILSSSPAGNGFTAGSAPAPTYLAVQATGTNPFRQSKMVTDQTTPQMTIGGYQASSLESIPVFPGSSNMLQQQHQSQPQTPGLVPVQQQQNPSHIQLQQQQNQQLWTNQFG